MDKEAVREELNKIRTEIKKLKSDFSKKKNEKEDHFKRGEDYSKEIDTLYEEVKTLEKEHGLDKINEELEIRKKEHLELKSKLDELEKQVGSIKTPSSNASQRPAIKTISSSKAQSEIKKLETQLQTQVLSLDKEGEIARKISELKGMVTNIVGDFSGDDSFKNARKDLRNVKKKFVNAERRIRSLYKQIRLISKEKKKKYKLIDDLRIAKKKAFDEFKSHKKTYGDVGKVLREFFKKEEELLTKLGESPVQKRRIAEKSLKVKQKEVEDKLMTKGQTLTTEDLLMLQSRK